MSTQTQPGSDGICRGQQHYQHGGPARGHVGCTFHGTPAPAFPFVGARAQVTVAEVWGCHGIQPSSLFAVGDIVTVEQMVGGDVQVIGKDGRRGLLRHPGALSPVPVSPGPDQPTEHEDWRVGEHYSIYVYAVDPPPEGEPECPACAGFTPEHDGGAAEHVPQHDRPVATFHRPEDAARAVSDHQDAPALRAEVQRLAAERDEARDNPRDEHHTMAELYDYRMLYNAHAARGWLATGIPVVRSWRHSDGEPCFGGGWFIVTATLPTGQVSNHYRADHWGVFDFVPEVNLPPAYDGHTPADASDRLRDAARAELAAAHNTDGPGLPQVIERLDGIVECDEQDFAVGLLQPDALRRDALQSLALAAYIERAGLADEATTDDKETDR